MLKPHQPDEVFCILIQNDRLELKKSKYCCFYLIKIIFYDSFLGSLTNTTAP
jgi:hypothetical protein